MQSNKWTFSLTSLVVILALAFVAPSAMAGDFGTGFDVSDVSHADGKQQEYGAATILQFNFGRSIAAATAGDTNNAGTGVAMITFDWLDRNNIPRTGPTVPTFLTQVTGRTDNKLYTLTIPAIDVPADADAEATAVVKVRINIPQGAFTAADPTVADADRKSAKVENYWIHFVQADASNDATTPIAPTVLAMRRVPTTGTLDLGEAFTTVPAGRVKTETFDVIVVLNEQPRGGKFQATDDPKQITASEASITAITALQPVDPTGPDGTIGNDDDGDLPNWTTGGRDNMVYPYLVTVKPNKGDKTVVIRVGMWYDQVAGTLDATAGTFTSASHAYTPPNTLDEVEGTNKLTVLTGVPADPAAVKTGGITVHLPHGDAPEIPADGYYILYRDGDTSGIVISGAGDENDNTKQTPVQLKYNARSGGSVNLETFLASGGTIDLITTTDAAMGDVVISEIMWGSDAANADSWKSQWIELHNTTDAKIVVGEKQWSLVFYAAHEVLPTDGYIDRVGTRTQNADGTTLVFWQPPGQSGRSDVNPTVGAAEIAVIAAPTVPLVSMQRGMMADGTFAPGTMASSWSESVLPATNFKPGIEGSRVGTPGAAPPGIVVPVPPTPEPVPTPAPVIPVATAADIGITEIMVDTDGGRLPQWIELTNLSSGAVSLAGWNAVIDNAVDADVLGGGAPITIDLGDVILGVGEGEPGDRTGVGEGQSLLLVAWQTRNSGNFNAGRVMNLAMQLEQTGRYQLLSYSGFSIALMPPQMGAVAMYGDTVGTMDWEVPMAEAGRSSLIRTEIDHKGMAQMGTDAAGWRLASATDLISGPTSWYGSDEDAGTPGYDSGGPLPVELSMFYPARDRLSGAVVITWETQSELNNAGFFIKRSEARNGKFVVINPTMIQGAGTTSEKQSYTYTDTSAKPNVVYYYQIEDVSLDGQRQVLTHGARLRGHIGAAGKLTTSWGELKKVQE